jgi:hypothetical protein
LNFVSGREKKRATHQTKKIRNKKTGQEMCEADDLLDDYQVEKEKAKNKLRSRLPSNPSLQPSLFVFLRHLTTDRVSWIDNNRERPNGRPASLVEPAAPFLSICFGPMCAAVKPRKKINKRIHQDKKNRRGDTI